MLRAPPVGAAAGPPDFGVVTGAGSGDGVVTGCVALAVRNGAALASETGSRVDPSASLGGADCPHAPSASVSPAAPASERSAESGRPGHVEA
jgi:hypothetical protein